MSPTESHHTVDESPYKRRVNSLLSVGTFISVAATCDLQIATATCDLLSRTTRDVQTPVQTLYSSCVICGEYNSSATLAVCFPVLSSSGLARASCCCPVNDNIDASVFEVQTLKFKLRTAWSGQPVTELHRQHYGIWHTSYNLHK